MGDESSKTPRRDAGTVHRWRRLEICTVVLLFATALGLLLFGPGGLLTRSTGLNLRQEEHITPKAELVLSLLPDSPPELGVMLEFRNVGQVPIKVDRDLVLLVDVGASGPNGEKVVWEDLGEAPRPRARSVVRRIVTLRPGRSVRRKIDLRHGFRQFRAAESSWVDESGHLREAGEPCELRRRLPDSVNPGYVWLTYGDPGAVTVDGLASYAGVPYGSLGLYEGFHWAAVDVSPGPSSGNSGRAEPVAAVEQAKPPMLWAVTSQGKCVYVDRNGRVAIPAKFERASSFSEGLGAVALDDGWGFIDRAGKVVIPARYDSVREFSEGRAAMKLGGKWGYIDTEGRTVVEPAYEEASSFSDGLGRVMVDGEWDYRLFPRGRVGEKYGFVDLSGRMVIAAELEWADDFHDGLAAATRDGRFVYVDKTGQTVIDASGYGWHDRFSEDLAAVQEVGGDVGFIDAQGNWVITPRYGWAHRFSEGLAAMRIDHNWGYVDRSGAIAVEPRYADAQPFSEGLAGVRLTDTRRPYGATDYWVFVDKAGTVVLSDSYNQVWPFLDGLAWVHVGGRMHQWETHQPRVWVEGHWRLIDKTGRTVWEQPDGPAPGMG